MTCHWTTGDHYTTCGRECGVPSVSEDQRYVDCRACLAGLYAAGRRVGDEPGQQTWRAPRTTWTQPPVLEEVGMRTRFIPRANHLAAVAPVVDPAKARVERATAERVAAVTALALAKARVLRAGAEESAAVRAVLAADADAPPARLSEPLSQDPASGVGVDTPGDSEPGETTRGRMREWMRRARVGRRW